MAVGNEILYHHTYGDSEKEYQDGTSRRTDGTCVLGVKNPSLNQSLWRVSPDADESKARRGDRELVLLE